jgi:hypothetical protein
MLESRVLDGILVFPSLTKWGGGSSTAFSMLEMEGSPFAHHDLSNIYWGR